MAPIEAPPARIVPRVRPVPETRLADELGDQAGRDLLDAHHAVIRRSAPGS